MVPISVLDLAPVIEGGDVAQSLPQFRRPGAPLGDAWLQTILDGRAPFDAGHRQRRDRGRARPMSGRRTSTIRIGAGGIMLPNHAPLTIAEQFGTLESLFPGRVDLGPGRAPGTDQAAAYALRRNLAADENQFPNDVVELLGYFKGENGRVRASPGRRPRHPALDSRLEPVRRAARGDARPALRLRLALRAADDDGSDQPLSRAFKPSEQLDKPYVMLGFNAFVADTDEEAELLSTSVQQAFVALRTGQPSELPPPKAGLCRRAAAAGARNASKRPVLLCDREPAKRHDSRWRQFVERTRPDELMVTAQIYDHEARARSYDLLMEAVRQPALTEAN